MKKNFVPRMFMTASMIIGLALNAHAFYGDEPTEAEKKEAARIEVTKVATQAAKDALPELIKAGLDTEAAKSIINGLIESASKELKVEDENGKETTLKAIIKELQKQHDDLALAFKNKGADNVQKGAFIEFIEKTMEANKNASTNAHYAANTTFKAAALMTTANVTPNVAGGFSPLFGNYIDTEIGHVPKPANIMLGLVTVKNQPGTESIWYSDRINEEGDAAFIGEGDLKPLADAEWVTTKVSVKEVAVRWKMTNRLIFHAPSVVSDFEEHARELVEQKVDGGILDGDNTGNNLNGIINAASAFIVPPQLAGYYERVNIYDVINAMASRIRLSNFNGKITAVLNTVWEAKMLGIKDAEGRYIMPEFVSRDGKLVASTEVVFSNKIDDNAILIGELGRYNLVWAEQVIYAEGYENDDFSKNLVSKKLEAFMGSYIKRSAAGAILYDEIDSVMEDIAVVVV